MTVHEQYEVNEVGPYPIDSIFAWEEGIGVPPEFVPGWDDPKNRYPVMVVHVTYPSQVDDEIVLTKHGAFMLHELLSQLIVEGWLDIEEMRTDGHVLIAEDEEEENGGKK